MRKNNSTKEIVTEYILHHDMNTNGFNSIIKKFCLKQIITQTNVLTCLAVGATVVSGTCARVLIHQVVACSSVLARRAAAFIVVFAKRTRLIKFIFAV